MEPGTARKFIPETGVAPQRRRKARLACDPCRSRKTGCDGRRPICTACGVRGWADKCTWQDSVLQPPTGVSLVDLERRLKRLEHESRADPGIRRNTASNEPVSPSAEADLCGHGLSYHSLDNEDETISHTFSSVSSFMHDGVEVAGPHAPPESGPHQPPVPPEPGLPRLIGFALDSPDQHFGDDGRQSIILPPVRFAGDLLGIYWRFAHPVFPVLHRPTFEADYDEIWKPPALQSRWVHGGQDEVVFHAILNIALAIGCQRSETISGAQREYLADEFYKRSVRLVSIETLDFSTLAVVQLLLLRGLYLFYAVRMNRSWIMVGAAVRAALGIGLHLPLPNGTNQVDREMRRRVWLAGCIVLDRILAVTFGRPALISTKYVNQAPVPQPIDDQYLSRTKEGRQPDSIPSIIALPIHTVKLAPILDDCRAVSIARGSQASGYRGPDPLTVLSINSRLDQYLDDMPEHLKVDADMSKYAIGEAEIFTFRMQGHVLRTRVMYARLALLRQTLLVDAQRWAAPAQTNNNSTFRLNEKLHDEICALCLTTAHAVLEEVHANLGSIHEIPPWYSLMYTFSAATALIVSALSPRLGVRFDAEPAKTSWERAIRIFEFHKMHVASADRGREVMERYRDFIISSASRMAAAAAAEPGNTGERMEMSSQGGAPAVAPEYTNLPSHGQGLSHDQQDQQMYWGQQSGMSSFEASTALPPTVMEGLDGFLGSYSLDEAWTGMQQALGDNNWNMGGFNAQ